MDTETVVGAFVDLADTLVDDFDVIETLQVLSTRCVELLDAAAAGLMLVDQHGELRVAVCSSERARLLELFQLQSSEGPCLDCYHSGRPVRVDDIESARTRWPRFAAAAVDTGYAGVHALPMRLRGEVVGAMNLFTDQGHGGLDDRTLAVAQGLTDVATVVVVQDRTARRRELLTQQLQTALDSRVAIEQAKGLVAGRLDLDVDESFLLLRSCARRTNRRLAELVRDVVEGRVRIEELQQFAR